SWDFWQYWRNCDDRDVGKFLRLFTDLPLAEIARLEALEGAEINAAKVVLADAVTALCRGREAAEAAQQTAQLTFVAGGLGADLPTIEVGLDGIAVTAALTALGFVASNGEAKRKIAEGAVRFGDTLVGDPADVLRVEPGVSVRLSLGKKKHGVLRGS
ncbi:MAG: tyrosine--tRNA ligase, partial [Novosphingobium sp.]|nr:tyrosine--tRNA ligase [Novosphingobium sp.]